MKVKKIISLIVVALLIFHSKPIFSQGNCTIKGKVIEKNLPVEFASVLLFEISDSSKPVRNTITDSAGHFIMDKLLQGSYVLKIQLIGFLPERMVITLSRDNEIWEAGNISLAPISKQ